MPKSSVFHFEDDTCLLNIKSTIEKYNKYVNKDLNALSKWLNANKTASFNIAKIYAIIFKRKAEYLTLT